MVGRTPEVPAVPVFSRPAWIGLLLVVLLLAGCAVRPSSPPQPLSQDQAYRLLATAKAQAAGIRDLRGLARVRADVGGRSLATTQVILAALPDRFRAEVLSPFGQPLLMVATAGEGLEVLDPRSGEFFRGPVDRSRWRRLTGLPFGPEELVPLLLYQVPLLPAVDPKASFLPDFGYRLELDGGEGRVQRLEFDQARRLVSSSWLHRGETELVLEYGDFSGADVFPRSLGIRFPATGESVGLEFSELELNPGLAEEIFRLPPPEGAEVRPLPES